jgi:hypothetical protein
MTYPLEVKDKIEYKVPDLRFSYAQGLEIADKVKDYLNANKAILIAGPGELSKESMEMWNNAGDWVYHLNDTTLVAEIRPAGRDYDMATVSFGTAGKNAKPILKDLQSILDAYL